MHLYFKVLSHAFLPSCCCFQSGLNLRRHYPSSRLVNTVLFADLLLPEKPSFLSMVLFSNIPRLALGALGNNITYLLI